MPDPRLHAIRKLRGRKRPVPFRAIGELLGISGTRVQTILRDAGEGPPCQADGGCDRAAVTRGLCATHYRQLLRSEHQPEGA